jgi:hypothetical protein
LQHTPAQTHSPLAPKGSRWCIAALPFFTAAERADPCNGVVQAESNYNVSGRLACLR